VRRISRAVPSKVAFFVFVSVHSISTLADAVSGTFTAEWSDSRRASGPTVLFSAVDTGMSVLEMNRIELAFLR
jgi:hypothetical protein